MYILYIYIVALYVYFEMLSAFALTIMQDYACGVREQIGNSSGSGGSGAVWTGGVVRRVCLVLDCVTPHDFCPNSADLINLQLYVIARKKLPEIDALTIFYNIVLVVHSLHEVSLELGMW